MKAKDHLIILADHPQFYFSALIWAERPLREKKISSLMGIAFNILAIMAIVNCKGKPYNTIPTLKHLGVTMCFAIGRTFIICKNLEATSQQVSHQDTVWTPYTSSVYE